MPRVRRAVLFLLVLAIQVGRIAGQQPIPAGGEFQVNTYTPNEQYHPSVSSDGAGGFVVTWMSWGSNGPDTSQGGILGQRFAADGQPAGEEFQVNSYTTNYQSHPAVSPGGAGSFVVAWDSYGSSGTDTSDYSIQGQRFAADGSPIDDQFQVNSYTTGFQIRPAVSPYASGFVIVWANDDFISAYRSIRGQRFAADGSPSGAEFQVNTYETTSSQGNAAVGSDGAGGFVVTWNSVGSPGDDTSQASVQARRFGPTGLPVGGQFQVNTYTTSVQGLSSVGPDGAGGFVVVWQSSGSSGTDTSLESIQGQRFTAGGSPVGEEFQVNTYTTFDQTRPAVAASGALGFLITWESNGSYGSDSSALSVQGQRFLADGSRAGDEFQVNTYTDWLQRRPAVSPSGDGGFVIVWESYDSGGADTELTGIQGQRYTLPDIFSDGFESGDTSAWSTTVP